MCCAEFIAVGVALRAAHLVCEEAAKHAADARAEDGDGGEASPRAAPARAGRQALVEAKAAAARAVRGLAAHDRAGSLAPATAAGTGDRGDRGHDTPFRCIASVRL